MTNIKPTANAKLSIVTRTQATKQFKVPTRPAEIPATMGKEWAGLCRNLHAEGLWHEDRLPIVTTYLHNALLFRHAAMTLEIHGSFDVATGKPHPAQASAQKAQVSMLLAAKALGLTVTQAMLARQGDAEPVGTASQGGKWAAAAKGDRK